MKTSIYVVHFNKINFSEYQYNQLKKLCQDNFEYIVINNGKDRQTVDLISNFCKRNSLKELRPPHLLNFDTRPIGYAHDHGRALKFAYDDYISKDATECRVVMDSDVFPFRKFSFNSWIENYDVAGMSLEQSVRYISSYVIAFNKDCNLHNLPLQTQHNIDVGVWTAEFIKDKKVNWLKHSCLCSDEEIEYIFRKSKRRPLFYKMSGFACQLIDNCLIHYHQGSEWMGGGKEFHEKKFKAIDEFIQNVEEYNLTLDSNVYYENVCMDRWVRKDKYPLNNIR